MGKMDNSSKRDKKGYCSKSRPSKMGINGSKRGKISKVGNLAWPYLLSACGFV